MIELTINDKKIKAEKGTTILRAAMDNDIYIPNLCWDRRLKPFGGCRLCVVEVEGQAKLLAACSTPAENGMIIRTDTHALRESRKTVLELLLIHHPLDCPVCDKAGECKLQDLGYKYGPAQSRFYAERKHAPEDTGSPLIERNPNRCILCGKCVRVCWEHQGVGAINFIGRGFHTKISPAFEETLDCEFCGQCVDACPVGALGSKPYRHSSRAWYLDQKDSICPYCGVGCTITLDIREGRILRARGVDFKGINQGDLCGRGRYGIDFIYSENRLKTPLIRKNDKLEETSWEEALNFLSNHLNDIINTNGPDKIGAIGSTRCTIEDNYMLQKFMRDVIGTNNIDSSARFGFAKIQKAVEKAFDLKSLPIGFDSPINKDVILVAQSDTTATLPIWGLKFIEAKKKGSKLFIVSPRETKLSRHSDIWLRVKPGTSQVLLNGIMKLAVDAGLHLENEMVSTVENFSELVELVKEFTPERVSEISEIDKDEFIKMAAEFIQSESRLVALTLGAAENSKGLNTLLSAANLVMLTGDGPSALQMPAEYSNTYGLWQMGISPDILPGFKKIEGKAGKSILDMLYKEKEIAALYIMGEDPIVTFPASNKVEEMLRGLELLIVQDIRLTETAKLAHIVLPASSWAEKDGTFINASGLPQPIYKTIPPTGDSIPDWQIFRNLARFMNNPIGNYDLSSIRDEISNIKNEEGNEKWTFSPVAYEEEEITDEQYPIQMVTGNVMQHSGAFSIMSKSLSHLFSDTFIQVNDNDALKYGIEDGSFVKIESRRGSAIIKVRISNEVKEGMIFVPIHFPHARVNVLTYISESGAAPITAVSIKPA